MTYLEVDGAKLWFDEFGTGDEVILSCQSKHHHPGYLAMLADAPMSGHAYAIQARGYGRSTHQDNPPEIGWLDQWAADVISFADELGVDKFIYTGVSHGAGIGWHIARRHPGRLKAFVSVVGTPHDRTGDTSSSAGRRRIVDNPGNPEIIEEQLRIIGGATDTPDQAAVRDRTIAQGLANILSMSDEEARINQGMPFPAATTNEELADILKTIDVPTLLFGGMRDGVISPESTLRAAVNVPRAKAVLFEDEGHFVATERPERLISEIAIFLDDLNAGKKR